MQLAEAGTKMPMFRKTTGRWAEQKGTGDAGKHRKDRRKTARRPTQNEIV